jgi:hypothetical protein
MYSIYDCLGQPLFSFRIPSAPLYPGQPFIRSVNDVLQNKSSAFVEVWDTTADSNYLGFKNRKRAAGFVSRSVINSVVAWARPRDKYSEPPNHSLISFVSLYCPNKDCSSEGGLPFFWRGWLTKADVEELMRRIGFVNVQARTRGGFATLFGVAAGYALGGVPGAMVGAAISRVL